MDKPPHIASTVEFHTCHFTECNCYVPRSATSMKPLHVRVAEALGWDECEPGGIMLPNNHIGYPPGPRVIGEGKKQVPWFNDDWGVTGPLIERWGITISDFRGASPWTAFWHFSVEQDGYDYEDYEEGETPLIAVCNLLLALKEAGKLQEQPVESSAK